MVDRYSLIKVESISDFLLDDKNNLTPEQEVEVYQFYVQEMQNISNMDNPPEDRRSGGVGDADIQIMTRLYGEGEEQRKKLVEEAGDVLFMIDYLVKQNVFTYEELHARGHIKKEKLKIYSDLEL